MLIEISVEVKLRLGLTEINELRDIGENKAHAPCPFKIFSFKDGKTIPLKPILGNEN